MATDARTPTHAKLARLVAETSFRHTPEPTFRLASGAMSRFYVDCRTALSLPEVRRLLGARFREVRPGPVDFDVVGGLALGAVPVAIAISDSLHASDGLDVRSFVIRKEQKAHGLVRDVEGLVRPGERALVVDDVVTSGGSTIQAIRRSRAFGLEVSRVVVLVDRQEMGAGGRGGGGVAFHALLTLEDLLAVSA